MSEEEGYLYAYVKCGRKAWHLGKLFEDWEAVSFDRGNYTEHHVFRKPVKGSTADERQLARDYHASFDHEAA